MKGLNQSLPSIVVIAVVVALWWVAGRRHRKRDLSDADGRSSPARSSWRATARCGNTSARR